MTNREVLIKSLKDKEADICTVDYIACPYTVNPSCEYDGSADHTPCIDCKIEWLEKEWED